MHSDVQRPNATDVAMGSALVAREQELMTRLSELGAQIDALEQQPHGVLRVDPPQPAAADALPAEVEERLLEAFVKCIVRPLEPPEDFASQWVADAILMRS